MGVRIQLTEQDLIEAILQAQAQGQAGQDDAITVWELVQRTGRSSNWVRTRLRLLYEAGRVEVVRVPRRMLDGRPSTIPAYRLKDAVSDALDEGQ